MSNDISTSSSFLDSITWQETQVATTTEESDALTQEDFFSQRINYIDQYRLQVPVMVQDYSLKNIQIRKSYS